MLFTAFACVVFAVGVLGVALGPLVTARHVEVALHAVGGVFGALAALGYGLLGQGVTAALFGASSASAFWHAREAWRSE